MANSSSPTTTPFRVQSKPPLVIAVDGPAASGKGTISRKLAEHYGLHYLDTGSLYRAVAAIMLKQEITLTDENSAASVAKSLTLENIDEASIRTAEVGRVVAIVASMPGVRAAILDFQRNFSSQQPGAVLDGRDIGTVVCPDAQVKIFVTASPEIRAHRRWLELNNSGVEVSEAQILEDVRERDRRDAERAASPMKPAADAYLLDTSDLSIEAAFGAAVAIIDKAMG
ncbi:MAG: cytidylate kinase [Alphaproteobacteria bacterium HGW-Alphaproteobacteria-3]|nr:MAG: cytidylate kinase [Alphaproteobacteria bacterium HGW-Alphaproteobacteria-3]